ncbi:MAG: hypothetical protein O7F12_14535 [Nitrospirae bacterium]|nr:hypothetical protein [Nitrospirota bacterium]
MKPKWQIAIVTASLFTMVGGTNAWSQGPGMPPLPNPGTSTISGVPSSPQTGQIIPAGDISLPPQGVPGNCYARVWEPPVYGTETDKLLAKQPSERIEIIPAQYEWVEQKILVREAYERQEVVPAVYGTESQTLLVKPATTRWKKGRGLVKRLITLLEKSCV